MNVQSIEPSMMLKVPLDEFLADVFLPEIAGEGNDLSRSLGLADDGVQHFLEVPFNLVRMVCDGEVSTLEG